MKEYKFLWGKELFNERLFLYIALPDYIALGFSIGEVTYINLGILQIGFDWRR